MAAAKKRPTLASASSAAALRAVAAVALLLAAVGCSAPRSGGPGNTTTVVTASEPPPPLPTNFKPAPALGVPPAPDPLKPGLDYLAALGEHLQGSWASFIEDCRLRLPPDHALNGSVLAATAEIVLERDGAVASVEVVHSSGLEAYDQAVREVVEDGSPYATAPELWLSDDGRIHVRWLFARDHRQAGVAYAELVRVEWAAANAIPQLLARGEIAAAAMRIESGTGDIDEGALEKLMDNIAVAALAVALRGQDAAAQTAAVEAVVEARVDALLGLVRTVATEAPTFAARAAALAALGELDDRSAIDKLLEVAAGRAGQGAADSAAAARALSALGEERDVVIGAAEGLGAADVGRQAAAMAVFSQVPAPPAQVTALVERLSMRAEGERPYRLAAAAALGPAAASVPAAARALRECMRDADAALRTACVEALGASGRSPAQRQSAYAQLIARARTDADDQVRAAAVTAAARIDASRFGRDLGRLRAAANGRRPVRVALARALRGVSGPAAVSESRRLLGDDDAEVRALAARALVGRTERGAREALVAHVETGDAAVRAAAVRALDEQSALAVHFGDVSAPVRAGALLRWVELVGRPKSVHRAANLLARAQASATDSVAIATAWLLSGAPDHGAGSRAGAAAR